VDVDVVLSGGGTDPAEDSVVDGAFRAVVADATLVGDGNAALVMGLVAERSSEAFIAASLAGEAEV
jgi:hypothetical protein